ncbi:MAG: type 1 glutamine amidotransferase [Bacteroidales bacterium]|nr:type 1 glutamine amidotransferase [Bacteroidales bacterium]MCF8332708.1 type 1 glutamine amidotransferase [Bacteroidales bacterium]
MKLKDKTIVVLVHELFEDLELWYPVHRLREEGAKVFIAGPEKDKEYKGKHGVPAKSNMKVSEVNLDSVDGIVVPGGYAPDKLRRYPEVTDLIKQADDKGMPLAMICHAGWVMISAGILKGRKATSVGAIKDDMINAGTNWVDEPVVIDKNLVSSRTPADMHVYMKSYIGLFK